MYNPYVLEKLKVEILFDHYCHWTKRASMNNTADSLSYQMVSACTFAVFSILIIGGNSFCLLVLRRGEYMKTTTKALLTSLTCADLSMGLFCTFPRFLAAVFRSFLTPSTSTVICFATVITNGYFTTISTTSLLMVNFDRYFAIESPLRSIRFITTRRVRIFVAVAWPVTAITVGTFTLFLDTKDFAWDIYHQQSSSSHPHSLIALSIAFVFFFCLPVVLTIVFYARILIIVRRLQSPDTNLPTSNESIGRHNRLNDHKALTRFLLVTFVSSLT